MRTLGPRSVASFLKLLLDIAYFLSILIALFFGMLALGSAARLAVPDLWLPGWRWPWDMPMFVQSARGAARLLFMCLSVVGGIVILGRLRKVFATLTAGTPFVFENARRLRVIGLVMAALQASEWAIWFLLIKGTPAEQLRFLRPDIDIVGLFAIGVMFVLAEVFDEGARMRRDLDLTI